MVALVQADSVVEDDRPASNSHVCFSLCLCVSERT